MGRPKGGKNKKYTKEDRYEIIKPCINHEISSTARAKELNLSDGMVYKWIHLYLNGGIDALDLNGKCRGNHFAGLHTSKSLTEEERLRLENLKLRIENERLKKGYMVKGVGANKEFVSLKDLNSK